MLANVPHLDPPIVEPPQEYVQCRGVRFRTVAEGHMFGELPLDAIGADEAPLLPVPLQGGFVLPSAPHTPWFVLPTVPQHPLV